MAIALSDVRFGGKADVGPKADIDSRLAVMQQHGTGTIWYGWRSLWGRAHEAKRDPHRSWRRGDDIACGRRRSGR